MKITSREELQRQIDDIVNKKWAFDWDSKLWREKMEKLDKERNSSPPPLPQKDANKKIRACGQKFFIDYPLKIDGKLIYDGEYFLGERHVFVVKGIDYVRKPNYMNPNAVEFEQINDEQCISIRKCKVLPNIVYDSKPYYNLWGIKQEVK